MKLTNANLGALAMLSAGCLLAACGADDGIGNRDDGAVPAGTSSDSLGESGSSADDADDEGGAACVPGEQVTCPCPGGEQGVQACLPDGSGFDSCECSDGGDDSSGAGDESTGEPETCGDDFCDPDIGESCETCEADCGVCAPCTLAPTCEGAEIPPAIDTHADFLDDTAGQVPPEQLWADLVARVQEGGPGVRLIAAALSEPEPGEAHLVTALRKVFDEHSQAAAIVQYQLAAAGLEQIATYTLAHPAPGQVQVAQWAAEIHETRLAAGTDPSQGGVPADACDDPRMRIRVERITVHEEDDDVYNDEVYCIITAEAASGAELKVTPMTAPLDEGDDMVFGLESGLVWGHAGMTAPESGILLTYDCIESDNAATYGAVLDAVANAADQVGGEGIPGVDGWVFPAIGAVAGVLSSALALDGDDQLFNASHTVTEDRLLELTPGAYWSVRRDGTHLWSDWDWELRMEIWGCHNYGTL